MDVTTVVDTFVLYLPPQSKAVWEASVAGAAFPDQESPAPVLASLNLLKAVNVALQARGEPPMTLAAFAPLVIARMAAHTGGASGATPLVHKGLATFVKHTTTHLQIEATAERARSAAAAAQGVGASDSAYVSAPFVAAGGVRLLYGLLEACGPTWKARPITAVVLELLHMAVALSAPRGRAADGAPPSTTLRGFSLVPLMRVLDTAHLALETASSAGQALANAKGREADVDRILAETSSVVGTILVGALTAVADLLPPPNGWGLRADGEGGAMSGAAIAVSLQGASLWRLWADAAKAMGDASAAHQARGAAPPPSPAVLAARGLTASAAVVAPPLEALRWLVLHTQPFMLSQDAPTSEAAATALRRVTEAALGVVRMWGPHSPLVTGYTAQVLGAVAAAGGELPADGVPILRAAAVAHITSLPVVNAVVGYLNEYMACTGAPDAVAALRGDAASTTPSATGADATMAGTEIRTWPQYLGVVTALHGANMPIMLVDVAALTAKLCTTPASRADLVRFGGVAGALNAGTILAAASADAALTEEQKASVARAARGLADFLVSVKMAPEALAVVEREGSDNLDAVGAVVGAVAATAATASPPLSVHVLALASALTPSGIAEARARLDARKAAFAAHRCGAQGCPSIGGGGALKKCNACKSAAYCSAACQNVDWKSGGHAQVCAALAAASGAVKIAVQTTA